MSEKTPLDSFFFFIVDSYISIHKPAYKTPKHTEYKKRKSLLLILSFVPLVAGVVHFDEGETIFLSGE